MCIIRLRWLIELEETSNAIFVRASWKLVSMVCARLLEFVVSCDYFNEFYDSFLFIFFYYWLSRAAAASSW